MANSEDKEFYIDLWERSFNQSGCGTPLYAVIIFCIIMALSSCATKKRIVETDHTTTTVKVDSTDTQKTTKDTTSIKHTTEITNNVNTNTESKVEKSDSTVLTVDTNGNVVKQETWHKEKETVSRNREYEKQVLDSIAHFRLARDSLRQYVAKCDSLQEQLTHKEYTVVEKTKIPKWCWYCLGFTILGVIFAFVKIIRWVQIH
jgi:hypothetical protein